MKKNLIKLCALAITGALFITSCSNEEESISVESTELETENTIQFEAVDELNNGQQESLKRVLTKGGGKTDRTITQMVISIEDENGNPVYEDELIPVINQNGNIVDLAETFAEHLPDLTAESYTITKVVFLNDECTPLYAVPTVTSPLISETTVVLSLPQVMTRRKKTGLYKFHVMRSLFITEDRAAADFGYEIFAPCNVEIPDFALSAESLTTTPMNKEIHLTVDEINGAPSQGDNPIFILIRKSINFPISFDPSITFSSEGVAVNNSDWILNEDHPQGQFFHALEYVGNAARFPANSSSTLVFNFGITTPSAYIVVETATMFIAPLSGGEENFPNNTASVQLKHVGGEFRLE